MEDVLAQAIERTDGDEVSLGDVVELFEDRTFGPIFTLLGLIVVIPPVGAIPVLPAIVGLVLLAFSVQVLVGRNHVWLPGSLADMSISKDKLEAAEKRSHKLLATIDGLVTDRLEWATSGPARYVAALLVSLMALALVPLELVPFAVAAPGLAISLVGLALMARDGALMIGAYLACALAIGILVAFAPMPF